MLLKRQQIESGKYKVTWGKMDVTGYCHEANDDKKDNYVKLYHLTRRGQIKPNSWYVRQGEVVINPAHKTQTEQAQPEP